MTKVYKICPETAWQAACASGAYSGSEVDQNDGFIHLSAAEQVAGTAARHFAGQRGLVIVEYDEEDLPGLTWETSRGGALFPHVYGVLPAAKARRVAPLPLADGRHVLPWDLPQ
jgi:uncharacterized protein (DUF952 family)